MLWFSASVLSNSRLATSRRRLAAMDTFLSTLGIDVQELWLHIHDPYDMTALFRLVRTGPSALQRGMMGDCSMYGVFVLAQRVDE